MLFLLCKFPHLLQSDTKSRVILLAISGTTVRPHRPPCTEQTSHTSEPTAQVVKESRLRPGRTSHSSCSDCELAQQCLGTLQELPHQQLQPVPKAMEISLLRLPRVSHIAQSWCEGQRTGLFPTWETSPVPVHLPELTCVSLQLQRGKGMGIISPQDRKRGAVKQCAR